MLDNVEPVPDGLRSELTRVRQKMAELVVAEQHWMPHTKFLTKTITPLAGQRHAGMRPRLKEPEQQERDPNVSVQETIQASQ